MPMLQNNTIELQHNRNIPYFIMDNSSEVKSVKTELGDVTSTSNLTQTSRDIEKEHFKEEIVNIHYSETKTESNVYEREFLYMPSTSFVINSQADIKTEMSEPLIKTECEKDEFLLDPLDVNNMKGNNEEHFDKKYIINQNEEGKCIVTINDIKISENQKPQQNKRNTHVYKKRKHRCDLCNSMFRQKSDLVNHLRIHSGERPFTCEICQKSFNQKSNLHNHMIIHTDQKTHVCDICTKVFRHKANLKEHRLFHSGEKPYLCDICDKSFTRNPDLIKHKRVHTGERPYSCELCSRSFTQSSALQTHKKRLHKDL